MCGDREGRKKMLYTGIREERLDSPTKTNNAHMNGKEVLKQHEG
jgi:hypothetical protein